ncbi:MAG: hypothetical protein OM95_07490 [Bdellovibrio sp. ArHS]|uniref:hypothetical protein n=1 Tax=Bdellovibrio sp. ArHS TaxID=1569284 RepID=UPI0005832F76|nr:hypothetical protein [Bdellovibrio sp. ArHS]KHD88640.1 MAG: hypothetical protein OM95_07490 [Bdellovibrio sp. ArHS]
MNKNIRWAFLAVTAFLSLHCSHKEKREPAATKSLTTDAGVEAAAEIFGGDSPTQAYRHPLKINFYTNGDQKYLSTTARKALEQALTESLSAEVPEQALAKLFVGNLKESVLENFVKTLRVFKIINTGLQVDLTFTPEPYRKDDYSAELSSNQLFRLSDVGTLSRKWENLEKATMTGSIYNNSVYVPIQNKADYIGGVMTLYVEIMDLKPGIPKPSKKGVKGYVRYRRYYRVNDSLNKPMQCENFIASAKGGGNGVPVFYTVDIYKNFNLKNLIPTDEYLEVYPGLLATSSEGRSELMPDKFDSVGKSVQTATYTVEPKRRFSESVSFKLKKLVYDMKTKEININKSSVDLVEYIPDGGESSSQNQDMVLNDAKRQLFKKCEKQLESFLNLQSVLEGRAL